jgi:hypothetical protein
LPPGFIPVAGIPIGPAVVADVAYNSADDFGIGRRRPPVVDSRHVTRA